MNPTKLISFDVGIKNLAYCIFSIPNSPDSSQNWEIVSWNCVNLLTFGESQPSIDDIPLCQQSIPGKRKSDAPHNCGKHAKWRTPDSSKYYCEKHAKIHNEWQIPRKEHSSAYLNKLKVEPLKQTYETAGIQSDGTKLTKKDMIERLVSHYGRICYVPAVIAPAEKKLGAGEVDLITIGRKIKQCLDSDPEIVSDNNRIQVLIENQISTIATRMKTIQGMIAQYFIMRFEQNATIEFVSSHNKLKGFVRDPESQKSGYKANKMDGIRICSEFFDKNPAGMAKWREAFDKSSKRDDLADCFLQGITRL